MVSNFEVARQWFLYDRLKRGSSIIATPRGIEDMRGYPLAKLMNDGFILVNTDFVSRPYIGSGQHWSVVSAIKERAISVSFEALREIGIETNKLHLLYRAPESAPRSHSLNIILGIDNTERCLMWLRDNHWVGFVEPHGLFRDPEAAIRSLVPKEVPVGIPIKLLFGGSNVVRHGEFYLIPRPEFKKPRGAQILKWQALKLKSNGTGKNHTARDVIIVDGIRYVRGTIRHTRRKMLSLARQENKSGKKIQEEPWFEVAESNQVGSWKAPYFWR